MGSNLRAGRLQAGKAASLHVWVNGLGNISAPHEPCKERRTPEPETLCHTKREEQTKPRTFLRPAARTANLFTVSTCNFLDSFYLLYLTLLRGIWSPKPPQPKGNCSLPRGNCLLHISFVQTTNEAIVLPSAVSGPPDPSVHLCVFLFWSPTPVYSG